MPHDLGATTCPLCLFAQDPDDMVHAEVDMAIPKGPGRVSVCRRCANAIAKSVKDTGDLPPVTVSDEPAASS